MHFYAKNNSPHEILSHIRQFDSNNRYDVRLAFKVTNSRSYFGEYNEWFVNKINHILYLTTFKFAIITTYM